MKRESKNVQEIGLPGVDPEGAVPVGEVREEQAGEMPASAEVPKGVEGDKGVQGPCGVEDTECSHFLGRKTCDESCPDWDICRFGQNIDELCVASPAAQNIRCIGRSHCVNWSECRKREARIAWTRKGHVPEETSEREIVAAEKCRIYADPDMICAEDECGEWEACKNIQPKCVYIGYENSDCNPRICYNFAICHYGMRRESANRSWRQSVGLE